MLEWWRERRKRARRAREQRRALENLQNAYRTLEERVEAALAGVRADGAAWKLAAGLQRRVEALELAQKSHHQEYLAAIELAHETARSAVNSVKGARGGRGNTAERQQFEQFGRDIDTALKTPEGRAALIDQVRGLEANGAPRGDGPQLMGDFTPGPT